MASIWLIQGINVNFGLRDSRKDNATTADKEQSYGQPDVLEELVDGRTKEVRRIAPNEMHNRFK